MTTRIPLYLILTMILATSNSPGQTKDDPAASPQTVAEASDFKSTSTSQQVIQFVGDCSDRAEHVRKFVWGSTVEGRDLVGAIVSTQPYELGRQDDRNVVLLLGNIHSGECAGKEALLILLRELTHNPNHPWLANNVIVFAPNYNADGNDRMGKRNRPGQIGPENGMGRRENAQQLDLNRDFCKIESPEARALVALIDKINPHLFVDCHTTNGSKHRYALTYDVPHNPTTASAIRSFLRDRMMPEVTAKLDAKGVSTFYYGNFSRDNTKWTTYGHEPRYSTEYVGLRGRLAVLSEAYSYISYRDRIAATKSFVSELLDFVTENHAAVHEILASVDNELIASAKTTPERIPISLDAKVSAFEVKCKVKGFKDGQPHEYECEFVGKYEPLKTTQMPFAYLLPDRFSRVADRLRMHGVDLEKLNDDVTLEFEIDKLIELDRSTRAFQKHKFVRAETERRKEHRRIESGAYVIRTAQPLGRFVSYMLESSSDDGFLFWNFLDDVIEVDVDYPVFRIASPVELPTDPVEEIKPNGKLKLSMIDGPHSLLDGFTKPPKWFGQKNWLKTTTFEREFLMDAVTASFVNQPARPYAKTKVSEFLQLKGLDKEAANDLAEEKPLIATNGRYAVFSQDQAAAVYFLDEDVSDEDKVIMLGRDDDDAKLFDFSEDENRLGYSTRSGLHLLDLSTRKTVLIPAEHEQNLVGQLDWVYQEELYGRGNFKAFWWNPDGRRVAFLSLDESPVIPFTVMDHMPVRGESEITNYPKAGDPLPTVKVGVVDFESGSTSTVWIDLSRYAGEEVLVSRVTWSADGQNLLLQIQNREQTWLDLVATDKDGANAKVLFRDQTPAWIESPGDPVFVNDREFIWISPRDGYRHLYKYDLQGKLIGQLTKGQWEVRELIGMNAEKEFAYFTAAKENAYDMHCYRIQLDNGQIEKITEGAGSHTVDFSHDFSLFLDTVSRANAPKEVYLRRNDGEKLRRLDARTDDRFDYLDIREPEFMQIQTRDGVPLDAMVIRPPDFDPDKKYPVLFHVYAGPQAPRVRNRFGDAFYLWHQYLAQQGYVVWMCDNRSASYRSAKNVWPIHKNMAVHEMEDILDSVQWLKKQPWVDANRIGIWGWSYGGYMTLYAMTHSNEFKMGISGAPVTDWKNYDAIYTERYMGLPQDNPEGYEISSVLNKAENLQGELLLIHGTIDDNVHLNNSIQLMKILQDAGKQFELMMYPGNRHSVKDKKQAGHLRKLMTDFVLENL